MLPWQRTLRAFTIQRTLLRHRMDAFAAGTPLMFLLRVLRVLQPWLWFRPHMDDRGQSMRKAMEDLGPVFIKFGQLVSTRRDLFPADITAALAALQDQVEPFDNDRAHTLIREALGVPIESIFSAVDRTALASASVAQVYGATLLNGERVVIKILRPNIEHIIHRDLDLLQGIARFVHKYFVAARRFRLPEIVSDYRKTIFDELDLRREAANAAQLRRNFENSPDLYIPKVYWDYTRGNLMIMERISGIPIAQTQALRDASVDMHRLAEKGVTVFFTQVFRDNFFHADMHPGNIFVDATDPKNPRYIGVDCGIMGTLTEAHQRYLAENFLAFFNRDYRRVAQLHLDSGWIKSDVDPLEFEAAIRTVCEPIFGKPLSEISFGQFLLQLFKVARRFDMQVQPQLVLLQKTLLYVEGLGRQLYPQLDLWLTAKPFLENWMKQRLGVAQLLNELKVEFPRWREKFPQVPQLLFEALEQGARVPAKLERLHKALDQSAKIGRLRTAALLWGGLGMSLVILGGVAAAFDLPEIPAAISAALGLVCWLRAFIVNYRALRV